MNPVQSGFTHGRDESAAFRRSVRKKRPDHTDVESIGSLHNAAKRSCVEELVVVYHAAIIHCAEVGSTVHYGGSAQSLLLARMPATGIIPWSFAQI